MIYKQTVYRRRRLRFAHIYLIFLSVIMALALTGLLARNALNRTYVITDGTSVVTYTTVAASADRVLDRAGVTLRDNDSYTTEAVEGVQTIRVCRARNVTVHYHGQLLETASQGETVEQLLARLNLTVSGEDRLSYGLDTMVWDGMELWIDRVVTVEEAYTGTIPCQTLHRADPELPMGEEYVLSPGEDGVLQCTARVTYVNGEETERLELTRRVTREPVDRIVVQGVQKMENS